MGSAYCQYVDTSAKSIHDPLSSHLDRRFGSKEEKQILEKKVETTTQKGLEISENK